MKVKRNNLTDQLMNFQQKQIITTPTKRQPNVIIINYDEIIEKQSKIIESLYKQCVSLRQKINRIKNQQLFASEKQSIPEHNLEKFAQTVQEEILKQIAAILQISNDQINKNKVIQTLKRWKWQRNKKAEPIFIQRIKQVKIPVPIEVIKPVQKIIEKIIIQQKIIEKPIFRQKIVQKFIYKVQDSQIVSSITQKQQYSNISKNSDKMKNKQRKTSQDSIHLSTNSNPKDKIQQKQSKQFIKQFQSTKSSYVQPSKNAKKYQHYRPQQSAHSPKTFNLKKNPSLGDLRQSQSKFNQTHYNYKNNYQKNQFQQRQPFNKNPKSSLKKNSRVKLPSSSYNNNNRTIDHHNDDYDDDRYYQNDQQQPRYKNQSNNRQNYDLGRQIKPSSINNGGERTFYQKEDYSRQGVKNDRTYYKNDSRQNKHNNTTYYKNSYDRNKQMYSPKNNNEQKYFTTTNTNNDNNYFDKNRFLDSSKINHGNKNIKKRDKNDYYARER